MKFMNALVSFLYYLLIAGCELLIVFIAIASIQFISTLINHVPSWEIYMLRAMVILPAVSAMITIAILAAHASSKNPCMTMYG